jgi:hypothetical protein
MSFVDCYLPYFRQRLITGLLSAFLLFQSLFTESLHGDHLLVPPSFSGELTAPRPLCCVLVFSSLFIVYFLFVCVGVSLPRGLLVSQGWLGEYRVTLGTYLFGLLNVSQAGLEVVSRGSSSPLVLSV